jgi:hypothetical protein
MDPREESAAFFEPRQRFFFCKKEAKNSYLREVVTPAGQIPAISESFCRRPLRASFFQKRSAFFAFQMASPFNRSGRPRMQA